LHSPDTEEAMKLLISDYERRLRVIEREKLEQTAKRDSEIRALQRLLQE
jgi:hypothetical protein